jgi:hypothetical protein
LVHQLPVADFVPLLANLLNRRQAVARVGIRLPNDAASLCVDVDRVCKESRLARQCGMLLRDGVILVGGDFDADGTPQGEFLSELAIEEGWRAD